MKSNVRILTALAAATAFTAPVFALNTNIWRVADEKGFLKGDLDNVVVSSSGEVSLGVRLNRIPIEEIAIWSALITKDGTMYAGTGNRGNIYKLIGDKMELLHEGKDLVVTSLAESPDGTIYAGTLPEGYILKIGADGSVTELAKLEDPYIWALAVGPEGTLYAGTGEDGKLYKIRPDGTASVLFDSKEDHILSLAVAEDGSIFAGTTFEGILYKIRAGGEAEVVNDFKEDEVRSLFIKDGYLYIGTNRSKKFKPKSFVSRLQKSASKTDDEKPSPFQELFDGIVYRMPLDNGGPEPFFEFSKSYVIKVASDESGNILVATGDEGRVFRVRENGTHEIFIDFKENQAMALATDVSGKIAAIGTGNSGALFVVDNGKAQRGTYTSEVIDASFHSRWGALEWLGEGSISFQTRSGNTEQPDDLWTAWSQPRPERVVPITSGGSRFLQFRAVWENDPKAVLRSVSVSYLPSNRRPIISSFSSSAGNLDAAYKGEDPKATKIDFSWKADDPNDDKMVFDLFARDQKGGKWLKMNLDGPITKTKYTVDSVTMPDGWYIFRLEASDRQSNPADRAYVVEKSTEPILVDNRKPEIVDLLVDKELHCEAIVEDSFSNIAWFEFSLDGSEWQIVYPEDSIFDGTKETFRFPLGELTPGLHTVTVRALDTRGNLGTRSVEFTKQVG